MEKSVCKRGTEVPEEIWVDIVTRLPFRSITRFKAVSKRWRHVIESTYFRRLFMSAHQNSSSSWSLIRETHDESIKEVVAFHGCERYGLPRPLGSYIPLKSKQMIIACTDGLVLLHTIANDIVGTLSVGNPVLNKWVQLPRYPFIGSPTGLVTRVEDGVVLEYKVVCIDHKLRHDVNFDIYSSQTGKWTHKQVHCPRPILHLINKKCFCLNKMLHWLDQSHVDSIVAYDFFADDEKQQCRVIPFPYQKPCFATYTTSGGFLMYINKIGLALRLWRLEEYTSDSGRWQLLKVINLTSVGCDHRCFPMAMHPFETHIIYMGTPDKTMVSIDLKTCKLTHYSKSSNYSDTRLSQFLSNVKHLREGYVHENHDVFYTPQFVLPQFMGSVPHSTSLLSTSI